MPKREYKLFIVCAGKVNLSNNIYTLWCYDICKMSLLLNVLRSNPLLYLYLDEFSLKEHRMFSFISMKTIVIVINGTKKNCLRLDT